MIFISILFLIVAIALPTLRNSISSLLFLRISSIIFIYAGALSVNAFYIQSIGSGIGVYSGLFQVTLLSQFVDIFIFIMASFLLVAWPLMNRSVVSLPNSNSSLNRNVISINTYPTEYSLIVLMSTLGATLLISSADLISIYLSIELQSFGVYILSSLYRHSESAISAGLKYFLLGGLSSCIILLGSALIYTFTGLTNLDSIYSLITVSAGNYILQGLSLGFILIFIGFFFKIAAAPLHNWSPDVYDDSPSIVTIWLTTMPKISIIILLLEIYTDLGLIEYSLNLSSSLTTINKEWMINSFGSFEKETVISVLKNLILISSLISLIIGTTVGLAQSKIKRLLAYSTISHIGFILLALAINTEQSVESLIFYIIQYSITNLNTFLIIIALGLIIHNSFNKEMLSRDYKVKGSENDINYISELKGQFYSNPLLSISLTICLFSMAGIPPLIGFFSKQFVLYAAIQKGYYFISIVAIIVSVISASYYLNVIKVLHSNENISLITNKNISDNSNEDLIENKTVNITNFHSFLISSLTLSILIFILKPYIILNSTTLLSLSLFNF